MARCYGCMKEKTQPVCEHCGYNELTLNAPHQLPAGTILRGQYQVGRVLGQGGFGITYLGWDLYLETPIAIKEYYPNGFVTRECSYTLNVTGSTGNYGEQFISGRERFLREAKSLARFSDVPEIVHVRNFFEANNTAYIVMEFVDGITLKQYIRARGGRLTAEETFAILRPVMEALSTIHKVGIIHRDISPDNIMMLPRGRAKLLDFGAARDVSNADTQRELPRSTEAILKHGFAPIEQYQRRGSLGPWTDVYALCATIYYCLTGAVPPDAPERMIGDQELRWLERAPGLSVSQAEALEQGMAPLPKDRTPTVDALYNALFDSNWAPPPRPEPTPTFNPNPIPTSGTIPVSGTIPASGTAPAFGTVPLSSVNSTVGAVPVSGTIPVSNVIPNYEPMPVPNTQIKPRKEKGPILAVAAAVILLVAGIGIVAGMVGGKAPAAPKPEKPAYNTPEQTFQPTFEMPTFPEIEEPDIQVNADRSQWENNVLMADPCSAYMSEEQDVYPVFGSKIPRGKVISITCLDTLEDAPSSKWDISRNQNGTVYAWADQLASGYYDLYLAAEGGINAGYACEALFMGYRQVQTIRFNGNFHTDDAVDMGRMFYCCESLQEVDVEGFRTSNVKDMGNMFSWCGLLTELDLRNFDTSRVTNMSDMFYDCESLTELDVSSFNTSMVEDMSFMFSGCKGLTELDLSNFDTSRVENMQSMFQSCRGLLYLDLSNFYTPCLTDMGWMFNWCDSIKEVDIHNFDTSLVTEMNDVFSYCDALETVDFGEFETDSVETYEDFLDEGVTIDGEPWENLFK